MRQITAVLLASASMLTLVASASAEGGPSIATAPVVTFGQRESGTTNDASFEHPSKSYWLLNVTAGDVVVIDSESQDKIFCVESVGSTDLNSSSECLTTSESKNAGSSERFTNEFTAPRSGTAPMFFVTLLTGQAITGKGSPYAFTAYVTHALKLGPLRVGALHRSGTLIVPVHRPDGGPINDPAVQVEVQIKARGLWKRIGMASAANSAALVSYTIPSRLRHQRVAIRAVAHGSGYRASSSATVRSRTL